MVEGLNRFPRSAASWKRLCKARVEPALVDAFSQALKQFKQTEAFQAIYHKYFP